MVLGLGGTVNQTLLLIRRAHWRTDAGRVSEQGKIEIAKILEILKRHKPKREDTLVFAANDDASLATGLAITKEFHLDNPCEGSWLKDDCNIVAHLLFNGTVMQYFDATSKPTTIILIANQVVLKKIAHNYAHHIDTGGILKIDNQNGPPEILH